MLYSSRVHIIRSIKKGRKQGQRLHQIRYNELSTIFHQQFNHKRYSHHLALCRKHPPPNLHSRYINSPINMGDPHDPHQPIFQIRHLPIQHHRSERRQISPTAESLSRRFFRCFNIACLSTSRSVGRCALEILGFRDRGVGV